MEDKNNKLRAKFRHDQSVLRRHRGGDDAHENLDRLFEGVTIFVNGLTEPTHSELKDIMMTYGGCFENYYSNAIVTHIICSNLTDQKLKLFAKERRPTPIVHPKWIPKCPHGFKGSNAMVTFHSPWFLQGSYVWYYFWLLVFIL